MILCESGFFEEREVSTAERNTDVTNEEEC
jgi:hypothetical protein